MKTIILSVCFVMGFNANAISIDEKINILAEEIENLKTNQDRSKISLGGYGEVVFKDYSSEKEDGSASVKAPGSQWDTLRNVIYVGYSFNRNWSFKSEIEIEHANEIYTEFAELRFNYSDALNFKVGLLLAPMGLINTVHEPTRFFGVNRPEIESKIIPTTWRENGGGVFGRFENISYGLYIMNSLDGDDFKSDGVRSGRQKGANAKGGNWAYIAKLNYSIIDGFDVGGSVYKSKTNGLVASGNKHDIYDIHSVFKYKGLIARTLYTISRLDGKKISAATAQKVADQMSGWYGEVGYNLFHNMDTYLAPYIRYEKYNLQDKVDPSIVADKKYDVTNVTYGLMYKPIDKISFKADYTKNSNKAKSGVDYFSFGMGWEY